MIDDEFTISETTLLCAFDYALGRMTYVVGSVVSDITTNAELVSSKGRQYMIKKIHEKWQVNALGHDIDREQWVNLLKRLNEIEEEARLL